MKLLQRKSKKKGFTLVELMVVIAIIAVLLLVAVPKLTEATKGSKVRTFEANYRTIVSAVNAAYADGGMDNSAEGLEKIKEHPAVKDLVSSVNESSPDATATYVVDENGILVATYGATDDGTGEGFQLRFNPQKGAMEVVTDHPKGLGSLKQSKYPVIP